jgi:hypothetical protein
MTGPIFRLTIRMDAGPLDSALVELSALTKAAGQVAHEFRDAFVRLVESGKQLFTLQNDLDAAPGTHVTVIRANPSDGFLRLLAAARAGNFDALIVEQIFGHDCSSVGCVDSSNEGRASGESQGSSDSCPGNSQVRA